MEASERGAPGGGPPEVADGAPRFVDPASVLPLPAKPADARRAVEGLLQVARGRGIPARLFGHVAPPPPHRAEVLHAALGAVVLAGSALAHPVGWASILVLVSAALRAIGAPNLAGLLLGRPCWSVLLRAPAPGCRRVVAAVVDRARVLPVLPRVVAVALGVGVLATLAGPELRLASAALLAALAGFAALLERPEGSPPTAELAAVRVALDLAARGDPHTAVVLAAGASADGHGVRTVLDWWALDPAHVSVEVLGSPRATLALARDGWSARTLPEPNEVP